MKKYIEWFRITFYLLILFIIMITNTWSYWELLFPEVWFPLFLFYFQFTFNLLFSSSVSQIFGLRLQKYSEYLRRPNFSTLKNTENALILKIVRWFMLKIVKVARFSDIWTRIYDIICNFAAEINNSLKNGNFLEKEPFDLRKYK